MLNFKKGSIFSRSAGNEDDYEEYKQEDRSTRLNSSHPTTSRMPSSA